MKLLPVDIESWRKQFPRASKWYSTVYVDVNPEGSMEKSPYSYTRAREIVLKRDHWQCRICGEGIRETKILFRKDDPQLGYRNNIEVHHIIPKNVCKTHHPANLITLCRKCHLETFDGDRGGLPDIQKTKISEFT